MKLQPTSPTVPAFRNSAAFTMAEMALCIAVVSLALVAIIGVLPAGLNVQKTNREETVVNEDAKVLLHAIRTGATNTPNLLPQIDFVIWEQYRANAVGERATATPGFVRTYRTAYWNEGARLQALNYPAPILLTNTAQVLALLSMPRYVMVGQVEHINIVRAQVRALSGPLTEKLIQPPSIADPSTPAPVDGLSLQQRLEFSFRYLLTPEVTEVPVRDNGTDLNQAMATSEKLHDVALVFQWPVILKRENLNPNNISSINTLRVGNNRRAIRVQVHGDRQAVDNSTANYLQANDRGLQLFAPGSY